MLSFRQFFDWKFSILILQEMDEIEIQYKSTTAAAASQSTKNLKERLQYLKSLLYWSGVDDGWYIVYHVCVVGMKNSAQCYFTVDLLSFTAIHPAE